MSGHARSGPETVVTIILEERDGKTLMTFRQGAFDTQENWDGHRTGSLRAHG